MNVSCHSAEEKDSEFAQHTMRAPTKSLSVFDIRVTKLVGTD